jgi:hypothetical protein
MIARADAHTPPPSVRFGSSPVLVNEYAGSAVLSIQPVRFSDTPLALQVTPTGGPAMSGATGATPGADFAPVAQTVTLPVGALTMPVRIPITNDTAVEGNETVTVSISGAQVSGGPAIVIILDDDRPGGSSGSAASRLSALKKAKPGKRVTVSGTASGTLRGVDVAIVQFTRSACKVVNAKGKLTVVKNVKTLTACAARGFVPSTYNASKCTFGRTLAKGLPKGSYTVYSRARPKVGPAESNFSAKAGNQATLKVG